MAVEQPALGDPLNSHRLTMRVPCLFGGCSSLRRSVALLQTCPGRKSGGRGWDGGSPGVLAEAGLPDEVVIALAQTLSAPVVSGALVALTTTQQVSLCLAAGPVK